MLKDYFIKLLALSLFSVFAVKVQAANDTLRVCAAQDELPYSNSNKEGFENRIAEVVAEAMGRQLCLYLSRRQGREYRQLGQPRPQKAG